MDPIMLSLLSIGASGMVIRRCLSRAKARAADGGRTTAAVAPDPLDRGREEGTRVSALRSLSRTGLRVRSLVRPEAEPVLAKFQRIANSENLLLGTQVSLGALFAPEEGSASAAAAAADAVLAGRRVDVVLSTASGTPLCGVEIAPARGEGAAPGFRDHVRARAFAAAGLPLATVPADADWTELRDLLCAAMGQPTEAGAPAANDVTPISPVTADAAPGDRALPDAAALLAALGAEDADVLAFDAPDPQGEAVPARHVRAA
ncbi:DUF2726 domain-containing protein [Jannaschia sp. W003]|uniref:DUF2726 domain-containing protein n=1 Tax=Jannaschia sp. W003 TaxID=2867012 RepID=UPI0021A499AF|nr:DUF2726 domain-containing protein [Jannaschia sp. W003]UWQ21343.1 DUF2726 domain-containing protein [Jannaschia sp. W003]